MLAGAGQANYNNGFIETPPRSGQAQQVGLLAAAAAAPGVKSQTPDHTLTCRLCNSTLTDARVLPCLHSYCLGCLKGHVAGQYHRHHQQQQLFHCPCCKQVVTLKPGETLDSLPMNTYYANFVGLIDGAGDRDIHQQPPSLSPPGGPHPGGSSSSSVAAGLGSSSSSAFGFDRLTLRSGEGRDLQLGSGTVAAAPAGRRSAVMPGDTTAFVGGCSSSPSPGLSPNSININNNDAADNNNRLSLSVQQRRDGLAATLLTSAGSGGPQGGPAAGLRWPSSPLVVEPKSAAGVVSLLSGGQAAAPADPRGHSMTLGGVVDPDMIWKGWTTLSSGGSSSTNTMEADVKVKDYTWSSVVGSKPPPGFHASPQGRAAAPTKGCGGCGDKGLAVAAHCKDCEEDLCASCVAAHQRVKLTRHHSMVPHSSEKAVLHQHHPDVDGATLTTSASATSGLGPSSQNPPEVKPSSVSPGSLGCVHHAPIGTPGGVFGASASGGNLAAVASKVQQSDVLRVYANAVEKAKGDCNTLIRKANNGMDQINECLGRMEKMVARIENKHKVLTSDLKTVTQRHVAAVKEREQFLCSRLDKIRSVKLQTLEQQRHELLHSISRLKKVSDQLEQSVRSGREMDLINGCNMALEVVKEVQDSCGALAIQEDDVVEYSPSDPNLLSALGSSGFVGGSGFAPASFAEGDGLKKAILGRDACFVVVVRDQLGEQRTAGSDPLRVTVATPDGRPVRPKIFDGQNGTYRIIWKPSVEGEHVVGVTLKERHIRDSPFVVRVRVGRNYQKMEGEALLVFGLEGEGDGQLCRPWGVCCSREGYIMVANRSNNRIEVFNPDGSFRYKFGTSGKQNGQFDRPASVVCDHTNRAIVADKDNHRVQVFTVSGEFLMLFGEKGQKSGQFNYPWDVACNSKDQILVSDTRNHRIQLFSPGGEFIAKYGFEGQMWKHFDSPRGVCFTGDDQAVVTDFNNHRLLVVKSDFNIAQFLGKEGTEDGMFMRPNGVAVDEEGYIIVADSRNDRVQIFTSSGVFVKKFGTKGTGPGQFDRPSGICLSPEGHIIVVDFGNNRVQVF